MKSLRLLLLLEYMERNQINDWEITHGSLASMTKKKKHVSVLEKNLNVLKAHCHHPTIYFIYTHEVNSDNFLFHSMKQRCNLVHFLPARRARITPPVLAALVTPPEKEALTHLL